MLNDPRTKEKLHRFFFTWLNLAEKDDLSKDLETFPGFDENVIADLRTSLTLFIEQVVWSEKSDYRQLFLSGELPVNQRLAMFYGTEAPKWGFANVPANKHRAGLFTHPYILSAFSYHKQTSPFIAAFTSAAMFLGASSSRRQMPSNSRTPTSNPTSP